MIRNCFAQCQIPGTSGDAIPDGCHPLHFAQRLCHASTEFIEGKQVKINERWPHFDGIDRCELSTLSQKSDLSLDRAVSPTPPDLLVQFDRMALQSLRVDWPSFSRGSNESTGPSARRDQPFVCEPLIDRNDRVAGKPKV